MLFLLPKKIVNAISNRENLTNALRNRNAVSTTISQQILGGRLLRAVIGRQKSNFNGEFKLKTC